MAYMEFVPGINRDYVRELREACGLETDDRIVEATAQEIYERFCEDMDAFFDVLPDGVEVDHARLLGGSDWLYSWGPAIVGEACTVWTEEDWVEHAHEYLEDDHGGETYGITPVELARVMRENTNYCRMREDQTATGWDYVHFSVERPDVQRWIAETSRHRLAEDIQEAIQGHYDACDDYDPELDPDGLGPVGFFVQETELMLETPEGRECLATSLKDAEQEEGENAEMIRAVESNVGAWAHANARTPGEVRAKARAAAQKMAGDGTTNERRRDVSRSH